VQFIAWKDFVSKRDINLCPFMFCRTFSLISSIVLLEVELMALLLPHASCSVNTVSCGLFEN